MDAPVQPLLVDGNSLISYPARGSFSEVARDEDMVLQFPFPAGPLPYSWQCMVSEDRHTITISSDVETSALLTLVRDLVIHKNTQARSQEYEQVLIKLQEALGWMATHSATLHYRQQRERMVLQGSISYSFFCVCMYMLTLYCRREK